MWLSLGPLPNAGESRVSGFGLYGVLYEYVPGFNGVRVPARYAMIAGLFLAVLAGFGAAQCSAPSDLAEARKRFGLRSGTVLVASSSSSKARRSRWRSIARGTRTRRCLRLASSIGRRVPWPVSAGVHASALPAGTAITEFPFGDAAWEIRYVYYAAAHWKPITNGYSGAFPPRYKERVARLQRIAEDPQAAWQSLQDSGSTHAVIHRNAFANAADADTVENWLKSHGATEVERFPDGDILLKL